jgi:protein SCO1/2
MSFRSRSLAPVALTAAIIAAPLATAATDSEAVDRHLHHHAAAGTTGRSVAAYRVPNVELTRDDGKIVSFGAELDDGRPVVLAFIYTTCTAICPLTSQTLAELQRKLGSARERVHLMSITIDPEQDTPERLREYARKFHAGPQWQHYTGTLAASQAAQRAFGVYRGDKMSHAPAILVRPMPGGEWVRIDGFPTADELIAELPERHAAM